MNFMLVVGVCVSPALVGKGISDCSPKKITQLQEAWQYEGVIFL
jgi:hypothetical protein